MTNSSRSLGRTIQKAGRPNREGARAIPSRILTAAEDLFAKLGYERTTMDEVAGYAQVSKRTLYARFAGKDELFLATAARVSENKRAELEAIRIRSEILPDKLEELARELIALLVEPRFIAFERILAAEACTFPSPVAERVRLGLEHITSIVCQQLRAEPLFSEMEEVDLVQSAQIFVSMAILPSARQAMFSNGETEEVDVQLVRRAIDIFLSGLAGQANPAPALEIRKDSDGTTAATLPISNAKVTSRRRRKGAPDGLSTKDRILHAAMKRFASNSYDDTGLRDIAADVGVDVAYVHRSFGSKESLFIRALEEASGENRLDFLNSDEALPKALAALLSQPAYNYGREVQPLDIVIRSLASPTAGTILNDKLRSALIDPLASKLEEPRDTRAAVLMALLLGIGLARDLMRLPPLSDDREFPASLLEAVVETIMHHQSVQN